MNTELSQRLSVVKLLAMDVDGTLTDGAMYYTHEGDAMKRFSTRDGMGITLLHRAGIQTAIITSEETPIVQARAHKLKINHVILGSHAKHTAIKRLADKFNIQLSEIAFIGDDVNDYHAMKICGFAACPQDAVEHIKSIAHYVCTHNGGNGAVREFAEMILQAQNKETTLPEDW
ncbi:MAG: HAD-IIIA family hydrolase [Candidatus Kapabacteria bacterium]|nr:HAD-IIIA family hydrolase [Candidatus Kapabacteria bacterium]